MIKNKSIFIVLLFAIAICLSSCDNSTCQFDLQHMTKSLLMDFGKKINSMNLEGGGTCERNYNYFIKFKADDKFVELMSKQKYGLIEDCETVRKHFTLLENYDQYFSSGWGPVDLANKSCFVKPKVFNDFSTQGTHFIIFDWDSSTVYFRGYGSPQ